jgi:hypothetical protein
LLSPAGKINPEAFATTIPESSSVKTVASRSPGDPTYSMVRPTRVGSEANMVCSWLRSISAVPRACRTGVGITLRSTSRALRAYTVQVRATLFSVPLAMIAKECRPGLLALRARRTEGKPHTVCVERLTALDAPLKVVDNAKGVPRFVSSS